MESTGGVIQWLPAMADIPSSERVEGLDKDAYNHPVVILSPQQNEEETVQFTLTRLLQFISLEFLITHSTCIGRGPGD